MALTLELPAEVQAQLQEKAAREGQEAEKIAASLLAQVLDWEAREYAATLEAIRQGLADGAAGRVTPLAEWDAKFRARHGISPDAKPMSHEEAMREWEVEAIRKGLEDSRAGRVISLDDWDAKIRAQYQITSDAEPVTDEEARMLP